MTKRDVAVVFVLGFALLAPVTTAVLVLAARETPSSPDDPVGRYQALVLDGRLHLVDTTTGATRRLEWIDGNYEWWSVVDSVDDSMRRHSLRAQRRDRHGPAPGTLVPDDDLPPVGAEVEPRIRAP